MNKIEGLNEKQVEERIKKGLNNYDTTIETKSIKQIFKTNICTLFNFLNLFLGLLILIIGSYKNLLFLGTIFCNTFIGIIQELRSKKIIDKLALISSKTVTVIRNSKKTKININEIVLDDIIVLSTGNQIVTDSVILEGTVEVNEALITGEIDPIKKEKGDELLSGSFIISGECKAQVIHVREDNYTYKITKDAKYIKPIGSEIMKSLKQIIKLISYIIIPFGIIFFLKQININSNGLENSIINTVAALISIIPDGLMLLTSTVMAISVIKLSNYKVLVQELYCIENLARVDTICFDKTGTLTKGTMKVTNYIKFKEIDFESIIKEICYHLDNHNSTMTALINRYGKETKLKVKEIIPFSSEKKWSGITLENNKTYIIGALEVILKEIPNNIKKQVDKYTKEYRIILLAESNYEFKNGNLPKNITPLGIFLIEDELRKDSKKTIEFLEKNDVDVKIISGDNPKTVSQIAKRLNLSFADKYIDTSKLTEEELKKSVLNYSIFGRVTPQGKKILIKALQDNKRTVAMTGDGVNDVLALKQADCAIALAQGSEAARNVSQLVLLNSDFNAIPEIVKEGRRVINNIERSASLFITKTLYSLLLLILFLFVSLPYPFIPIQLTLTSVFTIGIPSFILALEPNSERIKGNFLTNVVAIAFPTAITIVFSIILLLLTTTIINIKPIDVATLGILLIGTIGFMHIYRISKPLNLIRKTLLIAMITSFLIAVLGLEKLFSLSVITSSITSIYLILMLFSYLFLSIITKTFKNINKS